ncbi:MAG TPA: hypothetical protein VFB02_13840 [Bradyrhizobium sp.]|nr:hypothetical protein [Bradyrhizobium sp.]
MNYSARAGAGASPFAHLLSGLTGGRSKAAAAADDERPEDEDDDKKAESDDDGHDDEDDDKKSKKAKKAEDDDGDKKAESDDDEDDDKKSKKAKKAKADDEDDGDDDHEEGKKAERARWSSVLKSPAAGDGRLAAACEMLATTDMSSKAIIRTLSALPVAPAAVGGLQARMGGVKQPQVGGDGGKPAGEADSFAAEMAAASNLARGG